MSQTALNLVAVIIFGMTFGSLLSSALGISPYIPASIAIAGLGLATIDRFAFDNLGVTLLVDAVAQTSPQHRERVLHHEAGHLLVAYLLGIPITGYALTAWEALGQGHRGQGGVRFDDRIIKPRSKRVSSRRCGWSATVRFGWRGGRRSRRPLAM